jgi:hypothetical protein
MGTLGDFCREDALPLRLSLAPFVIIDTNSGRPWADESRAAERRPTRADNALAGSGVILTEMRGAERAYADRPSYLCTALGEWGQ